MRARSCGMSSRHSSSLSAIAPRNSAVKSFVDERRVGQGRRERVDQPGLEHQLTVDRQAVEAHHSVRRVELDEFAGENETARA